MGMEIFVEELLRKEQQVPQRNNATNRIPANNEDEMKTHEVKNLRELYIYPMEQFMDEYAGIATELRGHFKITLLTLSTTICSK